MTDASTDADADRKRTLRAHMRALRDALPKERRRAAADALPGHADALGTGAGAVVSAFWPMGSEIDVRPLLAALDARGAELALPCVTRGAPLTFRRWRPGDPLVPAGFGTSEPPAEAPPVVPTLLLVPLLAFTPEGWRLGYGGGYYDRTLAALAASGRRVRAIGVGYRVQEVDALPVEPHDVPLDAVLTEEGLRRCRHAPP